MFAESYVGNDRRLLNQLTHYTHLKIPPPISDVGQAVFLAIRSSVVSISSRIH